MPSASTVTRAVMSAPGSKLPSGSPSLPRPLSPVRTPTTRPCSSSSFSPAVSGRIIAPPASACSARNRPSCESENTQLPWFIIVGGGGIRSAAPPVSRYTASPSTWPVAGDLLEREAPLEQPPQRARVDDGAGEQVRARLLALLQHRHRHVAEPLAHVRPLLEQLPEPDRAGQSTRAAADDEDADLDALVGRIGRGADHLGGRERRREVGRADRAHEADPSDRR